MNMLCLDIAAQMIIIEEFVNKAWAVLGNHKYIPWEGYQDKDKQPP